MKFIRIRGRVVPIKDNRSGTEKKANVVAKTSLAAGGAAMGAAVHTASASVHATRAGNAVRGMKMAKATSALFKGGAALGIVGLAAGMVRDGKHLTRNKGKKIGERMKSGLGDVASFYGGAAGSYFGLKGASKLAGMGSQVMRAKNAKIINPEAMKTGAKTTKTAQRGKHLRFMTPLLTGKK